MNQQILQRYKELMHTIRYCDPPLVAYYSDKKPSKSIGPTGGFFIELTGAKDIVTLAKKALFLTSYKQKTFRCMFQFLMQTRRTRIPSVFDNHNFGCPGCRFYLGFIPRLPAFNNYVTSTGFAGLYKGERFAPCPQSSKYQASLLEGIRAKGTYLIFEPFEANPERGDPEVVIFFSNPEIISGLIGLIRFVTDQVDGVQSPYASGCASIFSWPMKIRQQGVDKAVLGIFDTAARPYVPLAELSLSIPYPLFLKMLAGFKHSFLYTDKSKGGLIKDPIPGWLSILKRVKKIQQLLKDQ